MAILKDRDLLNDDGSISKELLKTCINNHKENIKRYLYLERYYYGDSKNIANYAKYITDYITDYMFSTPILYSGEGSDIINSIFLMTDEHFHNNELAMYLSIMGVGYELLFINDDLVPSLELATLNPINSFLVCDTTVKQKPMFGVTMYGKNDVYDVFKGYTINIYTENKKYTFFLNDIDDMTLELVSKEEHYFNGVPLIEYKNNSRLIGDFENVIELIDTYNLIQDYEVSDDCNDTNKFIGKINNKEGNIQCLKKNFYELKKTIKEDMSMISNVPGFRRNDLIRDYTSTETRNEILRLEQLGRVKEEYFKCGLRQRLKLIANIENMRLSNIDPYKINIKMQRSF